LDEGKKRKQAIRFQFESVTYNLQIVPVIYAGWA
jgi:hypothetical protein